MTSSHALKCKPMNRVLVRVYLTQGWKTSNEIIHINDTMSNLAHRINVKSTSYVLSPG